MNYKFVNILNPSRRKRKLAEHSPPVFYRGEQDYKGKTAFLEAVPQPSINTKPRFCLCKQEAHFCSIKVCKKAF